jgi:uncharacterized YccA/Bax inhibitor family protein
LLIAAIFIFFDMLEVLLVIIGEILFQIIGGFFVELILHVFVHPFRKQQNPTIAVMGYGLIGASIGGLSLLFFPTHLIHGSVWRGINIIFVSLIAGLIMAMLSNHKSEKIPPIYKNYQFYCGFYFALSWLAMRLIFAKQIV